jgi:CrcB protein
MTPQFVVAVADGGAIGSVARYLVAIGVGRAVGASFPWGTLIINITGSALIGAFISCSRPAAILRRRRALLTVGICGGYTTFSTFSLDTFFLIERGQTLAAAFTCDPALDQIRG